jgi:hypothetical protein
MNATLPHSEYLVLSRGQWKEGIPKDDIESAINQFYVWYEQNVRSGQFKPGSRLSTEAAMVSNKGVVTDGPFCEAKELIGGYWIIVAGSLREAANIAAQNPCLKLGLHFEIRPLEAARASAHAVSNESPAAKSVAS